MYHLCCHCRQFKSIPTGIPIKAATLNRKINLRSRYERCRRRKIGESTEELEIESEEQQRRGEKIEIDEDRPPAQWLITIYARMVKKRWSATRWPSWSLLPDSQWAHLCLRKGYFMCSWKAYPVDFYLKTLGYTFGFIIVIMARQQRLYREHGDRRSAGDAKPHTR